MSTTGLPLIHTRFAPPRGTEDVVEHTWVLRSSTGLDRPVRSLVVPNARGAVAVALGDGAVSIDPLSGERGPASGVIGLRRVPVVLEHVGSVHHVGLRLRPYAFHGSAAVARLVDRVLPLETVLAAQALRADLRDVPDGAAADEERATVLARAVAAALPCTVPPDRRRIIDDALVAAEQADGLIRQLDVARRTGVNPSLLRTVLDEFTGVGGPELLAIVRLHHFLGSGTGPDQGAQARRALATYPVHAHPAREVLRFTGMEPEVFVRVRDGLLGLLDER